MSRQASGLWAWVFQRLTAILLLLYFTYLLLSLGFAPPENYLQWVDWVRQPSTSIGLALFAGALLLHAWVGVRDAIIDYVHPIGARVAALTLLVLWLAGTGLWLLMVLV